MGNAQSAGHPNRLSKPKTNTNSPFLVAKADSPVSVSSQYADLSARDRHQIKTQLLSPVEPDFGSRASSDGGDVIGELACHVQRRLSTLSRSNSLLCFGSNKASTTNLTSLPGSKLSLVSNPQLVDLDTALKILQEVKRNASPEDIAALHQALQPTASSPSPIVEQGLPARSSVTSRSSSSLTRRRSLVTTPGLATRDSPVESAKRTWRSWKTPHLQPQEEAKWKMDMMGSSPLTRLAALDLAEDGRESPAPRAQTPGDMDYSHLGSLKLGSLVVTNGAPSPAPSAKVSGRRFNAKTAEDAEDYFTASEVCDSPMMMKTTRRRRHSRSKSAVVPPTPPLHRNLRIPDEARKAKTTSRCDSPLKAEQRNYRQYADNEPEPKVLLRVTNRSAETVANDYRSELPGSPFDSNFVLKHSAVAHFEDHDEGFVSDDAKSFRQEAFRILDGTIFSEPYATSTPSQDEGRSEPANLNSAEKQRKKRETRRPPPKKVDSGYSSGGSFRTANRETAREGTVPTLSNKPSVVANFLKSGNGSDSDDTGSLYTFEEMLKLPISKPLPPLPTDGDVDSRLPTLRSPESSIALSLESHTTASPKTPVSVVSQFSIDSKASTQRRLQKRRQSYQELPVVQACQPIPEGSIPNIPDNVRSQFVRRLSETPAMECLTRTYPSKDHVLADESAVDDAEAISYEFPSSSPADKAMAPFEIEPERPPSPPPHGIRRSLSLFRNKSANEKQKENNREDENAAPNVVDLGTIATALGRSPYDVAMSTLSTKTVTSPTHPYQLGDTLPRAKSMVGMDSQMAADFARMRSKDRALFRPKMPQRPRSYHDVNLEAGDATASKGQSQIIIADVSHGPISDSQRKSFPSAEMPGVEYEEQASAESNSGTSFRARSTGRGPVVSQLVDKYDMYGQKIPQQSQQSWEPHARLWNQRRKSIGEGLRQRTEGTPCSAPMPNQRTLFQRPEDRSTLDRYGGGLAYGYEGRGHGIGGSAGTRQLHSYASRKSMHYSNQYGVDLSDVPVFVQRA